MKDFDVNKIRTFSQIFFLLLFGAAIVQYVHFVNTGKGYPNFIELIFPIGGFYDLVMWIKTGFIDPFHPAGMIFILTGIILTLFLGKGFCGWICPVGTVLDGLTLIRTKFLGPQKLPFNLPYPLKKILEILLYFIKFITMFLLVFLILSIPAKAMFFYYKTTVLPEDVSLYKFWLEIASGKHLLTLAIITTVFIVSYFLSRFWCKYLCPLGAFYGLFNLISFTRLKNDPTTCTHCQLCNKVCPLQLSPSKNKTLNNSTCISCLKAISICPSQSISLKFVGQLKLTPIVYGLLLIVFYLGAIALAKITGHWDSQLGPVVSAKIFMSHGIIRPWIIKALRPPLPLP